MNFKNTQATPLKGKYSFYNIGILCMAFMLIPFLNWAQKNPLPTAYKAVDISIQTKSARLNSGKQIVTETVSEPGAKWLRLFFNDVVLGANSTLTITSELDGATQTLNAETLKVWKNTSAYFNGDKVKLTLTIASGETADLGIKELAIGITPPAAKSQCGSSDDRIDANDAAVGRIVPVGCTGWIITNGRMVTAGHCVGSSAQILEFNVPKSNSNGSIVHPGPEDQYPINDYTSPYPNSPSQANDWAVFTTGVNTQTGLTALEAQGKSYNVTQNTPGNTIRITGFGSDTGSDNQSQQTHTGPLSSVTNTFVRYRADTTGGNSGSPIIDEATGNAVGVHAYGGCTTSGGSNSGERVTISAFWDAMGLDDTDPDPDPDPTTCASTIDSFPYSESFESNDGWSQASGDDGNWLRDSGGTPSSNTGPSNGADGSFYMFLEASTNGSTGQVGNNATAILISPCFDLSSVSNATFSFQNHMFGDNVGGLELDVSTNGSSWSTLWSDSGNQGNQWNAVSVSLASYLGEDAVRLRLVGTTGNGWSSDIAIDDLALTTGSTDPDPDPDPDCEAVDFNDYTITGFSNQDVDGSFSVSGGGASLSLTNNTWKYIDFNYTVTANTVIEFEFSSSSEGEIHGVGFENDNTLSEERYLKVYGTQDYGVTNYDNYTSGTTTYAIPVGNFYTGSMDRLVFINDNDGGSGNNSTFSNVRIYEGSCSQSAVTESAISRDAVTPILGTEMESSVFAKLYPNPTLDAFNIHISSNAKETKAFVYSILGRLKAEVNLSSGDNIVHTKHLGLSAGIYLVKIEQQGSVQSIQKLVVK